MKKQDCIYIRNYLPLSSHFNLTEIRNGFPGSRILLEIGILLFLWIGSAFGQGAADLKDAVEMFNVNPAHVPGDSKGAGEMLLEFKRRMKLLDQRVKIQIKDAPG